MATGFALKRDGTCISGVAKPMCLVTCDSMEIVHLQ